MFVSVGGGSDWLSPGKPHSLLRAAEERAACGLVPLRTCIGTGILLRREVPFVPTPTPNFTVAVTYSSLKDSFQANQFKSSWSVWAGGLLSSPSWRFPVLLKLTLDKHLMETEVLGSLCRTLHSRCSSLDKYLSENRCGLLEVSPQALLYPRPDGCGPLTLFP